MERKLTLDELGVKYKTDKSSLLHNYLVEYEREFPNPENIKCMLEVGLKRGSKEWLTDQTSPSLAMWGDFFPNIQYMYGFDIKKLEFSDKRVFFIKGDQGNVYDLMDLKRKLIDVQFILDDGSHLADHQLSTFLILWPSLVKGGVYIVEDCNPVVQKNLPSHHRIQSIIEPFLDESTMEWRYISSKNAGPNSSLIIRKI